MPMAPAFWHEDGALARALSPVSHVYAAGQHMRRLLTKPQRAEVPVICVGNLVSGGAGKTPVALALLARLQEAGLEAVALTRGYGGRARGPRLVDGDADDWEEVGDEALLLARQAPTIVGADRRAGAEHAVAGGADVIVMDDGFQNPTLEKDLSLLVFDGGYGLGNGRRLPAGPLRESLAEAMQRAHAAVIVGADTQGLQARLGDVKPVLTARLMPRQATDLRGRRVYAFAGIGRPQKFFETLSDLGAELVGSQAFADHHPYSEEDVVRAIETADRLNALAITTEKDLVRLPPAYRQDVEVLPVELRWDDEAALEALLAPVLETIRA